VYHSISAAAAAAAAAAYRGITIRIGKRGILCRKRGNRGIIDIAISVAIAVG
jgi:hypothetical protein